MSLIIFDKYEIIRRLAIGGMGEIFLARQSGAARFDRLVVIKALLPELARDQAWVHQFLEEARVAATLNHPNIVAVYEVGLWQGVYFIAMEFIRGESVSGLMRLTTRAEQRLPIPMCAKIARDAALGLDHAHCARDVEGQPLHIVHRDVSPENIMVRQDGVTKVVDFGIARAANRAFRTETGVMKGKYSYMTPEQLRRQSVDARSDQWALGVVLWELCTQKRLFPIADNDIQLVRRITEEPVPRPSRIDRQIPSHLDEIVMRMTQPDPDARYASCAAVAEQLERFLSQQDAAPGVADLAEIVSKLAGDAIEERIQDLTPQHEPFLITLKPAIDPNAVTGVTTGRQPEPTSEDQQPAPKRRRGWMWALLGLVVTVAAAAVAAPFVQDELRRDRLDAIQGDLRPHPPDAVEPAVLELTSTPEGALVQEGRTLLGKTPVRIEILEPDRDHRLKVRRQGYESVEVPIRLGAGESRELHLRLEKRKRVRQGLATKAKAKREGEGFLTLTTEPWVSIRIDDQPYGVTPLYRVKLAPGRHELHMVNEAEGIDTTRQVVIKPGETTKKQLDLSVN
ncbi:protein kinase [Myxococcota bacterium]